MRKKKVIADPGTGPPDPDSVRRVLLAAYDAGKRSLPWRGETDPYRIWVSEVMLQQTRVETVIPYYERWLERFPTLEALAEAEEDEVLLIWQGLGYYSRARRLHEGAQVVRERYEGTLPANSEGLRDLPGIGPYTAGAVASIAYGEVVPAVDGNVKRVLSRLYDLPDPSPKELRELAGTLVDPNRPGDFNQALMELGALVCTPRSPDCARCPLDSECLALERGTVAERPSRKPKKPVPETEMAVLVLAARDEDEALHFLLRKRPTTGLLARMWEFPGVEVPKKASDSDCRGALRELGQGLGVSLSKPATQALTQLEAMKPVDHVFSHLKVRYRPVPTLLPAGPLPLLSTDEASWVTVLDVSRLPLPVGQQKILMGALALVGG